MNAIRTLEGCRKAMRWRKTKIKCYMNYVIFNMK